MFCIRVGFPFTKTVCCRDFNGMNMFFCGVCSSVVINSKMLSMDKLISYALFPVAVCFAQGDSLQRGR